MEPQIRLTATAQSNKDAHIHKKAKPHTHARAHTQTHTRQGAQTDGFGTRKASQGLMKCEATTRKSKLFSFPHHAEEGDTPTLYFPI